MGDKVKELEELYEAAVNDMKIIEFCDICEVCAHVSFQKCQCEKMLWQCDGCGKANECPCLTCVRCSNFKWRRGV